MNRIVLLSAPDASALLAKVHSVLAAERASIETVPGPMPDPWDTVVILFLLSAGSLSDPGLTDYARQASTRDLPVVPVAEDLATYRFGDIPPSCDFLGGLNATG